MIKILFIFTIILLIGCSDAVIDTSSDEAMQSSIEKVRKSLPKDKQEEFDEDIKYLLFSNLDMKSIFTNAITGMQTDQNKLQEDMKKTINGKTGLQVIEEANRLKAERAAELKKQEEKLKKKELQELSNLEEKKAQETIQKEKLKGLKVISTSFKIIKNEILGKTSEIYATVKNNTKYPISKIYFYGKLMSDNRSIPWEEGRLFEIVKGGIEPGETKKIKLVILASPLRGWSSDEIPNNAEVALTVTHLFGKDGKELFVSEFSNSEKRRLEELKKKYKQ